MGQHSWGFGGGQGWGGWGSDRDEEAKGRDASKAECCHGVPSRTSRGAHLPGFAIAKDEGKARQGPVRASAELIV